MDDPEWSSFLECAFISVLESADEGIFVFDRDGRCRMIGRRAGELFGIEPAALVGHERRDVLRALAECCEEPETFLETVGANDLLDPPKIAAEIDVSRPRPRTLLWTSIPVVREGAAYGRLGLVRDVTRERSAERSLKQLQARLMDLTPVDTLTGLPNLRRFREELEREHGRSARAWDSYAVLRVDVDAMQAINEELGTPVGDEVLEQIGDKLKKSRREYDVVARFEADEFVVLLPGADRIAAETVARRMQKSIEAHDFGLADGRGVGVSIGGRVWVPPSAESSDEILGRAGDALARAKNEGVRQIRIDASAASGASPVPNR